MSGMRSDFAGKICLVTGGSKGQGRAISRELAGRGAHVIVNWFHDRESADETVALIRAAGGSAEHLRASVAKAESVTEMFAEIGRRHGRLDILVNNAARGVFEPAEVLTEHDWQRALDTNLHGPRRCARAALPLMRERGGSIVNLGSIGTSVAIDNYSCVAVCKGALEALTRYLAVEFAPYGIRVNMASASMLVSQTLELFPRSEEVLAAVIAGTPLGRLGRVEEHARLVAFLASDEASWMTGENVVNDGGLRLGSALARAGGTWGDSGGAPAGPQSSNGLSATNGLVAAGPDVANGSVEVAVSPVRTAPRPGAADDDCVAVVGMGLDVPGAESPDEFWKLLRTGEPAFSSPAGRYPAETFFATEPGDRDRTYTAVSGFVPAGEQDRAVPTASLSASWLRRAIRQALPPSYDEEVRAACFIGACSDGDQHFEQAMAIEGFARRLAGKWEPDAPDLMDRLRAVLHDHYSLATGHPVDHLPNGVVGTAIAGLLPPETPYTVVDTACSSSLYAIDLGAAAVLDGRADLALCGGYFMVGPRFNVLFGKLNGLSRTGKVSAFGPAADGTLFSDGAAIVALRRLSDAQRAGDPVLGVLAGFGAAADGRGKAIAAPNLRGQQLALNRSSQAAGIDQREVVWVVGHGTGTVAGDAVELAALDQAAPDRPVLCTSNKTLVGHTGWAAGATSVIHGLLGLRHNLIPGQRQTPRTTTGRVTVPSEDTALVRPAGRPRTVGVSGFGFGGTNGHQLIQDPPAAGTAAPRSRPAPHNERIVLVAWTAHLPGGEPTSTIADRLARRVDPAPTAAFPTPYPAPPFTVTRMPPAVAAAVDRTQLMALEVADKFIAEHGQLWAEREERTGVIGAHYGPTQSWFETTLRCYADDLATVNPGSLDATAFTAAVAAVTADVRATVVPTGPDSQPGLMGNVTASRIANRLNLNGPVVLADGGPASALHAVAIAEQYLLDGALDLALVLASNGNSSDELRTLLDSKVPLGEGAFLLALARETDALAAGWPVLAALSAGQTEPGSRAEGHDRDYLGASGAIDLLTAVLSGRTRVSGEFPAPVITVTTPDAQRSNQRYVAALVEEVEPAQLRTLPEPGPDWLILVGPGCEDQIPADVANSGAVIRTLDVSVPIEEQFPSAGSGSGEFQHLRMLGSTQGTPWPHYPLDDLLHGHEALFLAVKSNLDRISAGGSIGVHLSDELRSGVPHPATGLFTGIVKSLAWDLKDTALAVVIAEPDGAWSRLHREIDCYAGDPTTVHQAGNRLRTKLVPAATDHKLVPLRPGAVVVATGGARGITAACLAELAELAERQSVRLWLLGSSQLQEVSPELLAADDADLPRLRSEFLRRERGTASIPELSGRFDRLVNARESQLTLQRLRASCGDDAVHYLSCDLTDADDVRRAADQIRAVDPEIDLVLHGAGLHGGGDISRLTLAALRRIRDVKVRGYHHLKAAFPDAQAWCNFGSVAGLVGLPGETDYAPGNDYLHGAALLSSLHHGAVEQTMVWPIWSEVGMGGSDLMQSNNERAGIMAPLNPAEGVEHFAAELAVGLRTEPVVAFLHPQETRTFSDQFPDFVHPRAARAPWILATPHHLASTEARWVLDLTKQAAGYLADHLINGKPTMHGTGLATIAAEAATVLVPGRTVKALTDLRFKAFVAPKPKSGSPYKVRATVLGAADGVVRVKVAITSDAVDRNGRILRADREHFDCVVELGELAPLPVAVPRPVGKACDDPYYRTDSVVQLTGVYRATTGCIEGPSGSSARWQPAAADSPSARSMLENPPVPSVLLDALARTRMLQKDKDGVNLIVVPRGIERVEFFVNGGDAVVSRAHPDGILLNHHREANLDEATTSDGKVLIRITGCDVYSIGETPTPPSATVY
ncbi:SDR family oxidoreductase [Kribbella antibiotica]|uniref:SDR family oxidoreductase n=1 Tax=Kribbella antibiotica TaxID=190195 RepID=A0A4R4ZWX1_9ACTN|nr:SDR family oxidoreductase [Kribbella antibiotica]TDD61672.1 SDR family oxidoreductase [Kribbella antibiotica]